MTKEEQKAKLQEIIQEFSKDADIIKLVKEIEARPATTQHHYGDYGLAIARLSGGRRNTAYVIAEAMKLAGGNVQGIDNGFRLFCLI